MRTPACQVEHSFVPEFGAPVGTVWRDLQSSPNQPSDFSVAAPLSSTPLPIYRWITDHADEFENWNTTRFVLMDEQVEGTEPPFAYVPANDSASYEAFARRHLLDPLGVSTGKVLPVVKPSLDELTTFDAGIDLLILAIGPGGNYANLMPGTPLETGWHVAQLTDAFRQVHTQAGSNSYEGARFRPYGMSLGPQQVLAAGRVVVVASGVKKHALCAQMVSLRNFDPQFPISIVHHPDVRDRVDIYITDDVGLAPETVAHPHG